MNTLTLILIGELFLGLLMVQEVRGPFRLSQTAQVIEAPAATPAETQTTPESAPATGESSESTAPAGPNSSSEAPSETSPETPQEASPSGGQPEEVAPPENQSPESNQETPQEEKPNESGTTQAEQVPEQAPEETSSTKEEEPVLTSEETSNLNEATLLANPDQVDEQYTDRVSVEDETLSQAQTPEEKTDLLVQFAEDKVGEVDTLSEAGGNLADQGFLVARIDDQIDDALTTVGGLSAVAAAPLKETLATFAEKTDEVFRREQLVVPEGMEQEFEIVRGKLLTMESFKQ